MSITQPILVLALVLATAGASVMRPGPTVIATQGEVWPKPQQEEKSKEFFVVRPHSFKFLPPEHIGCPNFLDEALRRYWTVITALCREEIEEEEHLDDYFMGYLDNLQIELSGKCLNDDIKPDLGDDESYSLTISSLNSTLSANSIWGVLRGLETFSQLLYPVEDALWINATSIVDFPRFPHRGLLLDTSRHYMPVSIILDNLDAMALNKFNVFHWHITDDHSFPYQSRTFPELSNKGAYHPVSKIYTQIDVAAIIEYARLRGIRVIPEFDTPGHTNSWGAAYPELLTTCYFFGKPQSLGPMDPTKASTYSFITQLFGEVVQVFPDSYFHVGGDEVNFFCWQSNPEIAKFMQERNITDYLELENYFIQNVVDILDKLNSKYVVWEEVFLNGVTLPNSTVVHVWRGGDGDDGFKTLASVTKAGKLALFSSCWYLDKLADGGDWEKFYWCEPFRYLETEEQRSLVIGGEACMWAEFVNEFNVRQRIWPRASATAEKLWSSEEVNDANAARPRLEEHVCRMNKRGIPAQPPNGPGVCL